MTIPLWSCVTNHAPTGAALLNTQTTSALTARCKSASDDAKEDAEAERTRLCECLQARAKTSSDQSELTLSCGENGDITKNADKIYRSYKSRWPADFIALDPKKNIQCLENLTQSALELYYMELANLCQRSDVPSMKIFAEFKAPANENSCWQLTSMTDKGCFEAEPCVGTKADLKYLPLNPPRAGLTSKKFTLCNAKIQSIHGIKDPENRVYLYNNPFAIELCNGDMRNPGNYAAPNCHGTAQAVIGKPLGSLEMTGIQYRVLSDKNICNDLAERTLASKHPATIESIDLSPGGLLINMNHSQNCSALNCGDVNLYVDSCTPNDLKAFTFVNQMCIHCWARLIEQAGLKPLPTSSTPQDIKPGCMLTQEDHSVVSVLQSNDLCYFYESTSPYGPPQLRVKPCAALWSLFEHKWCPEKSMVFSVP